MNSNSTVQCKRSIDLDMQVMSRSIKINNMILIALEICYKHMGDFTRHINQITNQKVKSKSI